MHALSPRIRQLVALALLVIFLFIIGGFFKLMFVLGRDAVEQLYDARFDLVQAKQREATSRGILATEVEIEEKSLAPVLMWVGAASIGETRLQEILNQTFVETQFNLEQMRSAPVTQLGSLTRVSLDVTGSGSEASFYTLLTQIERSEPVIVIERLVVRSADSTQTGQDNPAGPLLSVEMRLSSFGTVTAQAQQMQSTP
jgi:hypothetical protein